MNTTVQKSLTRVSVIVALAFLMSFLSFIPIVNTTTAQAAATQTWDIYGWGNNMFGQLGQGTVGGNLSTPDRVILPTGVEGWSQIASGSGHTLALAPDGRIFVWGSNSSGALGLDSAANFNESSPTLLPFPAGVTAWQDIAAGGEFSLALDQSGRLWSWGLNVSAQLGLGDSGIGTNRIIPTLVPFPAGVTAWDGISAQTTNSSALTSDGRLFVWGQNSQGQLGLGDNTHRSVPTETPSIPGATITKHVFGHGPQSAKITTDDRLFVAGFNMLGQLGLGDTTSRNTFTYLPTPAGVAGWNFVAVGNSSMLAITTDGRLFAWGQNGNQHFGSSTIATGSHLNPVFVPFPAGVTAWHEAAVGTSFAFITTPDGRLFSAGSNWDGQTGLGIAANTTTPNFTEITNPAGKFWSHPQATTSNGFALALQPAEANFPLEKRLQKPEGTPVPNVTFTFTFERHSFDDNTAQSNLLPNIPNRTVTINDTNTPSSPVDGVVTITNSTNALAGIAFDEPGIYSYIVREQQSATGVGASSSVIFSQAEYEMRVYVAQNPIVGQPHVIEAITIHRRANTAGQAVNPPLKVTDLRFDNIYRRATTGTQECLGALLVSKTVVGDFAPENTPFDFQVTLARTVLCPPATTFTGRVLDNNDNPVLAGEPPAPRVYTLTSGTTYTIALTHNQRLVIDEVIIGSRFTVVELPTTGFAPSVVLHVNGTLVTPAPAPNASGELSTGERTVGVDLRNSAAFTNTYADPIPTGLGTGNQATLLIPAAIVILVSLLALKARRRIEQLPKL